jgi:hypothetical protein
MKQGSLRDLLSGSKPKQNYLKKYSNQGNTFIFRGQGIIFIPSGHFFLFVNLPGTPLNLFFTLQFITIFVVA